MMTGTATIKTRGELKAAVGRFVEDSSTNGLALIGDFLDQGYEEALKMSEWPPIVRWADSAVSLAAGVAYLHTPKDVREIIAIVDQTSPFNLDGFGVEQLLADQQGFAGTAGAPTRWSHVGDYGIKATLTAGSTVELVSDGTDVRTGTIIGIRNGETQTTSFTLNGTSVVAVSQTYDEILQFYVASTSNTRTVTLRLASAGATLATIGPGEIDAVYKRLRLNFLTGATTAYRIVYKAVPPPVNADSQHYMLPISTYLYQYAIAMYFDKRREYQLSARHLGLAQNALDKTLLEFKSQAVDVCVPYSYRTRPFGVVIQL